MQQTRIEDVQAHLPNASIERASWYYKPKNVGDDGYWFTLHLSDRYGTEHISANLAIAAPEGAAGSGFIEQTFNRISAEVARQDAHGWNAGPVQQDNAAQTSYSAIAPHSSTLPAPRPGRWHLITNQPLGVQIVGGLIATLGGAGILGLIAFIVHHFAR
ncbi:hypothetical protein [Mycobacterium sp. TY814]|uniref:hypothetical protein n=1 Tax=Mycobacterium sp. TY814 TaxID=3050580 RepID=UPI0027413233|nr:hypothetical protein [Mycobacterium sp. TY814]MDP7725084.1 hypothetical protein [Mycobacterium sp. TY814]